MTTMIPRSRFASPLNDWFNLMNQIAADTDRTPDIAPAFFMMDVQENPDGYVIEVTVPGVSRDEIDVELNEGRLNISVDKKDGPEVAERNYIHRETSEYRATRSVYLKDADTQGLTAQLKDGMLTVNVPKRVPNGSVTKILIG